MSVKLFGEYLTPLVEERDLREIAPEIMSAHEQLHAGTCTGADFLGWLDLPHSYDREEFSRIKKTACNIRENSDVFIVIGIGGSYLGARAAIEFLGSPCHNLLASPQIFFAGNTLSPAHLIELEKLCEGKRVSVNVISKSGTTTEPAIAFRFFKTFMERRYGKEGARARIYVTTDQSKGALLALAKKEGYQTFFIPDDIGGRYSVLTPVGLLPVGVAGFNLDRLLEGAGRAATEFARGDLFENDCYRYAATRNILFQKGRGVELFAAFEPRFAFLTEWLKQLFGESEGKCANGIFPASAIFSADLHSLGQFIQEGSPVLFETVMGLKTPVADKMVERGDDTDGLGYLTGRSLHEINLLTMKAVALAHSEAGVPNICFEIENTDEITLGYLFYFFEKACAVSALVLGVNPFDQPGVEAYKRKMFELLGKPGH